MKNNSTNLFAATRPFLLAGALITSLFTSAQVVTYSLVTNGLNTVTFGSGNGGVEVGDVDGDGDLDIVSIGDHGSPKIGASEGGIMVWKNNGLGTAWTYGTSGNLGYGDVALGDVNNDGKMDVGYGMHHNYAGNDLGDQLLEVALGDGTGSNWTPYDDDLADTAVQKVSWGMFGTDFADINNDGLLDIGSNAFGCCDGIWLYKNLGNGKWQVTDGSLGGNSNHWFQFGDFNNDGWADCVIANEWGLLWKNVGGGVISPMNTGVTAAYNVEFDVADVNNDGAKDVAISEYQKGIKVYTYNKSGSTWQSISSGLPTTTSPEWVCLDDMNMDGNCDVISFNNNYIYIFTGDGAGNWTKSDSIAVSIKQFGLAGAATGDFNHDGYTDIVYLGTPASGSRKLNVYLSNVSTPALNILPVFPKGSECFVAGSVQFVSWKSSVPGTTPATVAIDFSSAGSSGPWTTVVASAPNSGVYQWTVPTVNSNTCYLKFTITQGASSQSVVISNPFGIGNCAMPPPTSVNDPNSWLDDFQVFPNPVSEKGMIQLGLRESAFVLIETFDVSGRKIESLENSDKNLGIYRYEINSTIYNSGIYNVSLTLRKGDHTWSENKKLVIVR